MQNKSDQEQTMTSACSVPQGSTIMRLNIALFPWAADEHLERYCQVIEHYWYNILGNRNITLNWLPVDEWDGGYYKTPQDHFDIYIYDIISMKYFMSKGWLSALNRNEIIYAHEITPKILALAEYANDQYYGIPIYGCLYLLFYRSDDKELASVNTFEDFVQIASKRHFIMRKPGRLLKLLNYFSVLGSENHRTNNVTGENLNMKIVNRLSSFYKYSQSFLEGTDRYLFNQSSFYIGYTEDINTMLLVDETDLSQIEVMLVPLSNSEEIPYWLDCIGIHPQTKLRGTYDKSLQLANLMTCSNVMNECLQGRFYVITANHVTLSHLASTNSIYAKLQTLIESKILRPSFSLLPIIINSTISIQEQWAQVVALLVTEHQKEMQSIANASGAAS